MFLSFLFTGKVTLFIKQIGCSRLKQLKTIRNQDHTRLVAPAIGL